MKAPGFISPVALIVSVLVVGLGIVAALVATAFGPEVDDRRQAGAHPFSKSASGYGTLIDLLGVAGIEARATARLEQYDDDRTPPTLHVFFPNTRMEAIAVFEYGLPSSRDSVLLVLPKRDTQSDWRRPRWEASRDSADLEYVTEVAENALGSSGEVFRRDRSELEREVASFLPETSDQLQLLKSDDFKPLIGSGDGMLLASNKAGTLFVLSDPDGLSTVGLSTLEGARQAVLLFDMIMSEDQVVLVDATINGFGEARGILRVLFTPPWLGATLLGLFAFGLLVWRVIPRFGPPVRQPAHWEAGKTGLIENTTDLMVMAGRDREQLGAYRDLVLRQTAEKLGISTDNTDHMIAKLNATGARKALRYSVEDLDLPGNRHGSRAQREQYLARLGQWKREMLGDN